MHGSATHGRCSTSGLVHSLTDSQSRKNKELLQIAPVEGPCVRGIQLVDWCICGPTRRALKRRSRSGLIKKKYIYWCFYPDWSRDLVSSVCRIFYHTTSPKLYWSFYPHRSRELGSPVCRNFLLLLVFSSYLVISVYCIFFIFYFQRFLYFEI